MGKIDRLMDGQVVKPATKRFLSEIFSWWGGNAWGMRLWLRRFGTKVGTDEFGNTYWHDKTHDRRFVTYAGPADASSIPPGWYGWMHKRTDVLPTDAGYTPRDWQKPHEPNRTGTADAYRPDGSLLKSGERKRVSADYEAWSPE